MPIRLNPYLSFPDNARAAMEFYHSVFGGELTVKTFGESGFANDLGEKDKIMHAQLDGPDGMTLMASDTVKGMEHRPGTNYSISLSGEDESRLRGYWEKLSAGGTVAIPLERAPWGDTFGMCTDSFGISWMVNITPAR